MASHFSPPPQNSHAQVLLGRHLAASAGVAYPLQTVQQQQQTFHPHRHSLIPHSHPPSAISFKPFLAQGARVVAHYNGSNINIEKLYEGTDESQLIDIQADLRSESAVEASFDNFHEVVIQVLVVNHGIWPTDDVPIARMTLEQWNNTISTNLTSSFLVVREYLRRLENPAVSDVQREKAANILIGSTAGKYGEAGHADCASSKSGKRMHV